MSALPSLLFPPCLGLNPLRRFLGLGHPLRLKCLPVSPLWKARGRFPKRVFQAGESSSPSSSVFFPAESHRSVASRQTHWPCCSLLGRSCCSVPLFFLFPFFFNLKDPHRTAMQCSLCTAIAPLLSSPLHHSSFRHLFPLLSFTVVTCSSFPSTYIKMVLLDVRVVVKTLLSLVWLITVAPVRKQESLSLFFFLPVPLLLGLFRREDIGVSHANVCG